MVSGNILKMLDKNKVKDIMTEYGIDIDESAARYRIDTSSRKYEYELFNKVLQNGELDYEYVNNFLIEELNYGKLKNVYVKVIDSTLISNVSNAIARIKSLEEEGFRGAANVTGLIYQNDLWGHIDLGEKKLTYSKIICGTGGIIESINLLIGEGIKVGISSEDRANNYYSVEINLKNKYFVVRIRNWNQYASNLLSPDNVFPGLQHIMARIFDIKFDLSTEKYINAIYSIVNEVTEKALKTVYDEVNDKIKVDVDNSIKRWWESSMENSIPLNDVDKGLLINAVLNSFYKYYVKKKYGKITRKKMIDVFDLYAYPQKVDFIDDSAGSGKAGSKDTEQSLFDAATFYDLKARFEYSKHLNSARIYWLKCPNSECFGTTIYTDKQNLFKIVFLPKSRMSKEMCDHVLFNVKRNFRA